MGSIKMLALGLLLALLNTVSGVQLGGECWSSANGVAAGGCDQGTTCGPWAPNKEGWDNVSPWYCVAFPTLQAGATCDYANKVGPCAEGLSCNSGKCSDPSSVPTPAPTEAPTPAPTPAPTCTFEGGEICMDTNNAAQFANNCCKDPYTCDLVSGSTRTSMCNGKDLDVDKACWSNDKSSGTCKTGLMCKTPSGATMGTCTAFTDDPTCVATGVMGNNLCYNAEVGQYIKNKKCCNDFNTGSADVGCRPDYTNAPTGDRYCMPTKVLEGDPCGWTAASNYAGMCDRSAADAADKLECVDGKCAKAGAPTPPPPATDPPPACSKQGIKCYDGDTSDYTTAECCAGAACPVTSNYLESAYCPASAGAPECINDGKPTDLPGVTKCWDGTTEAAVPDVKCCYAACAVTSGTTDGYCPDPTT